MVIRHHTEGYEEFNKLIKDLESKHKNKGEVVFVVFSGSKDADGHSWCPDCVKAEPVINEALKRAPENSHFVYVGVGKRDYWKDPNCPFRKDERLRLKAVPTLVRWGKPHRLEENKCCNLSVVQLLFEDEDDD